MEAASATSAEHSKSEPLKETNTPLAGAILAGALVLLGTFANFTAYQRYPFLTPEVMLVATSLTLLAVIMAVIYRGQRQWGRVFLEVLLVALAVDFNTMGFMLPGLAALAALTFLVALKKSALPLLAITGLIVLVSSLLGLSGSRGWINAKSGPQVAAAPGAPAILHVILDGHIGGDGLPANNPEAQAMKAFLQEFYVSNGFRFFARAHSQHLDTVHSVPRIFNYGGRSSGTASLTGGTLGANSYFNDLAGDGYRLNLLETEWLEMCSAAQFHSCKTFWSPSLETFPDLPLHWGDKAKILTLKFLELSDIVDWIAKYPDPTIARLSRLGIATPELAPDRQDRTSSVNGLAAFNQLIGDLKYASPGDAFIAHILLPHDPYALNARCELLPLPWMTRQYRSHLATRQLAYFNQTRCATAKLGEALQAISASAAGNNFIVIVHGDHGSLLTVRDPIIERSGPRRHQDDLDEIASYSSLFAVRMPGLAPGYDNRPATVGALLQWVIRSKGRQSQPNFQVSDGAIILSDRNWRPRQRSKLPEYWLTGAGVSGPAQGSR